MAYDRSVYNTWERKVLRRIYGPVVEQVIRRIRTNQELQELCKGLAILADIKKKRLKWIGHLVRMDQRRVVKKILESTLEEKGGMGRTRLRWLGNVCLKIVTVDSGQRRMGICN